MVLDANSGLSQAAQDLKVYFDRLFIVVHERLELYAKNAGGMVLQLLGSELDGIERDFAEVLRTVVRHNLPEILLHESGWFLTVLKSRGAPANLFDLLVESWIIAIEGIIPPPACNVLAAPLQHLRRQIPELARHIDMPREQTQDPYVEQAVHYLTSGDSQAILQWLQSEASSAGKALYELIPDVLLRGMAAIGCEWERNRLPIYREHIATETLIETLAALPSLSAHQPKVALRALTTCAPSDHMQLVPMALATYLRLRGATAFSLGHGLPPGEIAAAAEAFQASVVFLSFAMVTRLDRVLELLAETQRLAKPPLVIVGGRGAYLARALLEARGAQVALTFEHGFELAIQHEGGQVSA
ncbi:MAG: cobalamin B12-binding domain-containing protein [Candidatus Sumerlaeaceae bacterium]